MPASFSLKGTVGPAGRAEDDDLVTVQRAMNTFGHYRPWPDLGFQPVAETRLFDGIRSYQRARGLEPDGVIRPGGPTEARIDADLHARETANDLRPWRDALGHGAALPLDASVGRGGVNLPGDVRTAKRALAMLGDYPLSKAVDPSVATGADDGHDFEFALGAFQRRNGLARDRLMLPFGPTQQAADRLLVPLVERRFGTDLQGPGGVATGGAIDPRQSIAAGLRDTILRQAALLSGAAAAGGTVTGADGPTLHLAQSGGPLSAASRAVGRTVRRPLLPVPVPAPVPGSVGQSGGSGAEATGPATRSLEDMAALDREAERRALHAGQAINRAFELPEADLADLDGVLAGIEDPDLRSAVAGDVVAWQSADAATRAEIMGRMRVWMEPDAHRLILRTEHLLAMSAAAEGDGEKRPEPGIGHNNPPGAIDDPDAGTPDEDAPAPTPETPTPDTPAGDPQPTPPAPPGLTMIPLGGTIIYATKQALTRHIDPMIQVDKALDARPEKPILNRYMENATLSPDKETRGTVLSLDLGRAASEANALFDEVARLHGAAVRTDVKGTRSIVTSDGAKYSVYKDKSFGKSTVETFVKIEINGTGRSVSLKFRFNRQEDVQ